ncbi:uncharacterized protein LOC105694692 [Orussus abietinus]|uniref:uncharacterized protein LOC105694692 n=1 Tax=Orussus abietinus TaxID=222816 RepID=UPI0006258A4C|nr:uncharacterized protein LOC105694692 [Orussus abietinus]
MATVKFIETSPYRKPKPQPPKEDYLFKKYSEDLQLESDSSNDTVVRVALFGAGRAGTIHLASIIENPRLKLVYLVEEDSNKVSKIKKYWHLDNVTCLHPKDIDRVLADPNIDGVIVATPTFSHEEIVTRALQAKKAVFCEKPISQERNNVMKCYETANKVGRPLFCAFNRRFDPSFGSVRERVRKGDIGHIQTIKLTSRDSPLPSIEYLASSGGIFNDCMVHDIDVMTWVLGEYPDRVSTQAHAHIPEIKKINDYDTVAVTLHFPSGTLGMIDLSRNSSFGYDQRLEVFGPKGMIMATNEQPIHCVTSQRDLSGLNTAPIWYSFPSRYRLAYRNEMNHFVDVVLGKCASHVLPKEILAVSRIAAACEESARTGKMVDLRWVEGELPVYQF